MKDTTDARVKFVEFVDRSAAVNVPQNAIVQHKLIGHVKRRTITCVVIGTIGVVQTCKSAASCHIINLKHINKTADSYDKQKKT